VPSGVVRSCRLRARGGRRQAHQHRRIALPAGAGRIPRGRPRDENRRRLHLDAPDHAQPRAAGYVLEVVV